MPEFLCPSCSERLAIDDAPIGAVFTCPHCGNPFYVPAEPPVVETRHVPVTVNVHAPRREKKSMATALFLTLLFGPFGLFYASPTGGIVMVCFLLASLVPALLTIGLSLVITLPLQWVIQLAWAAMACGE